MEDITMRYGRALGAAQSALAGILGHAKAPLPSEVNLAMLLSLERMQSIVRLVERAEADIADLIADGEAVRERLLKGERE